MEFISYIKVARQMLLSKIISPTSLIARDKMLAKLIIICTKNKEKFIDTEHKNSLKIN